MFTKTTIALSALLIVGATATVSAYDDTENKNSDRFPFLEQSYNPAVAYSVGTRSVTNSQTAKLNQDGEEPENKLADRFPFLAQGYNPAVAHSAGPMRVTGSQIAKLNQDADEPENKIGDRYPFLEQSIQTASVGSKSTARAMRPVNSVKISGAKLGIHRTARNSY